jgi:hypothetical protein
MPVQNSTIRQVWKILDVNGAALTGQTSPANITFLLKRDSGSGTVTASETVSFTELGSGFYEIAFTPQFGGLYTLFLDELVGQQRDWWFVYEVVAAGAVFLPAFANAFCAETDVERWTQLLFDGGSKPTSNQVAALAQARASEMRGMLVAEGWTISPTSVASGSIEQDMLREANAIGAAADAYLTKFVDVDPGQTAKAKSFLDEYERRLEKLVAYAAKIAGGASFIRSPMTAGEVTLKDELAVTDAGLEVGVSMDQDF